jgi:hypothetical protein
MSPTANSDPAAFAQNAAQLCSSAISLNREDARLGLKYLLLRLTTVGLKSEEVAELQKLGIAVFKKSDIKQAIQSVRRASASPLAVAIANVVEGAPADQRQSVLMGAVLSAHAAHHVGERRPDLVLCAAVNGAATAQTTILTQELIGQGHGLEFAQRE